MWRLFLLTTILFQLSMSQGIWDRRFGLSGKNPDIKWWRLYNEDWNVPASASDPQSDFRLYTLFKLDDRTEVGSPDWCAGASDWRFDPPFALHCVELDASEQKRKWKEIFEFEKPKIQSIITAHQNVFPSSQIHFSIGNEPNALPYVEPHIYAEAYKAYYDYIKNDLGCANCIIHNGGILLFDFLDPTVVVTDLSILFKAVWDIITLNYSTDRISILNWDVWTIMFLEHLAEIGGRVDIFNVHAYDVQGVVVKRDPIHNLEKFRSIANGGEAAIQYALSEYDLAAGVYFCSETCGGWGFRDAQGRCVKDRDGRAVKLPADNPCAWGDEFITLGRGEFVARRFSHGYSNTNIWVDEFGSMTSRSSGQDLKPVMSRFVNYFKATPQIEKWFWYKWSGVDPNFAASCIFSSDICLLRAPEVGLYDGPSQIRNELGDHYVSLQEPTFTYPYPLPRLAWSRPAIQQQYTGFAPINQASQNYVLMYDFSQRDSESWKANNFTFTGNEVKFLDGLEIQDGCPTTGYERDLTPDEINLVNSKATYLVSEPNQVLEEISANAFLHVWTLKYRNDAAQIRTIEVDIGNWTSNFNSLTQNRMDGVVNFKEWAQPNEELVGFGFRGPLSLGLCTNPTFKQVLGRVYFAKQNPVPIQFDNTKIFGVLDIPEIVHAGTQIALDVAMQTNLPNIELDIDANSKSKGMSYDNTTKKITWTPTSSQFGIHTITISNDENLYTKSFTINVIAGNIEIRNSGSTTPRENFGDISIAFQSVLDDDVIEIVEGSFEITSLIENSNSNVTLKINPNVTIYYQDEFAEGIHLKGTNSKIELVHGVELPKSIIVINGTNNKLVTSPIIGIASDIKTGLEMSQPGQTVSVGPDKFDFNAFRVGDEALIGTLGPTRGTSTILIMGEEAPLTNAFGIYLKDFIIENTGFGPIHFQAVTSNSIFTNLSFVAPPPVIPGGSTQIPVGDAIRSNFSGGTLTINNCQFFNFINGIDVRNTGVPTITNSLFSNNNTGIRLQDGSKTLSGSSYNAFFRNITDVAQGTNDIRGKAGVDAISDGNNLWDVDPEFVDVKSRDFRLRTTSKLINAGLNNSDITAFQNQIVLRIADFLDAEITYVNSGASGTITNSVFSGSSDINVEHIIGPNLNPIFELIKKDATVNEQVEIKLTFKSGVSQASLGLEDSYVVTNGFINLHKFRDIKISELVGGTFTLQAQDFLPTPPSSPKIGNDKEIIWDPIETPLAYRIKLYKNSEFPVPISHGSLIGSFFPHVNSFIDLDFDESDVYALTVIDSTGNQSKAIFFSETDLNLSSLPIGINTDHFVVPSIIFDGPIMWQEIEGLEIKPTNGGEEVTNGLLGAALIDEQFSYTAIDLKDELRRFGNYSAKKFTANFGIPDGSDGTSFSIRVSSNEEMPSDNDWINLGPGVQEVLSDDNASNINVNLTNVNYLFIGFKTDNVTTNNQGFIENPVIELDRQFSDWNFNKIITINTTRSGAKVYRGKKKFPVLLKLTESNFDFSSASSDGRDIRVTTKSGDPIPFEIENWDSNSKKATIWIKSNVKGFSLTELILYWGNPSAPKLNNENNNVFDSENNFLSVWHLNSVNNNIKGIKNSVDENKNGTAFGSTESEGKIGGSVNLNGSTDYIQIPNSSNSELNLPIYGNYSISAWVNINSLQNQNLPIIMKGDNQYGLKIKDNNKFEFVHKQNNGWDVVRYPARSNDWIYVVGVQKGERMRLYVNGRLVDYYKQTICPECGGRDESFDVNIGRNSEVQSRFFNGLIDELRISSVSRSRSWVKLNYKMQNENENVVVLQPDGGSIEGTYTLKSLRSDKCLDVTGASKNNGAPLIQWDCHNGDNQDFLITHVGNNYYNLINKNSGKCLDIYGGQTNSGAQVIQYQCHGGDNQKFSLYKVGENKFKITAKHSKKVFDVENSSTRRGAKIIQWRFHGGNNQIWTLTPSQNI